MGKKLLQINCDSNWGSIGRITEQIGLLAERDGWDCYIIYGRDSNESSLKRIRSGSILGVYEHYAECIFFDNDGLASRNSTYSLVRKIKNIKPDIIHLHNIHDHWINYEILFNYLDSVETPVIWTQHDCWSYTGGCGYYSMEKCDQWKGRCEKCPIKHKKFFPLIDRTRIHFEKKRRLFNKVNNLTLVPVSKWLENELKKSFLCNNRIHQIYNGIDVSIFHPVDSYSYREQLALTGKKVLMAAATVWDERKGLEDYIKLSKLIPEDVIILLVGVTKKQISRLPNNIKGIQRTHDVNEMVGLYSLSDIVLNLSYEETFGLTTVEGLACGTPGIVYNTTASPELITQETGIIVEPGNIEAVATAVKSLLTQGKQKYKIACRERAVCFYDKEKCFKEYIDLYRDILNR